MQKTLMISKTSEKMTKVWKTYINNNNNKLSQTARVNVKDRQKQKLHEGNISKIKIKNKTRLPELPLSHLKTEYNEESPAKPLSHRP